VAPPVVEDALEDKLKKVWTQEEDNILIDNYDNFKDLDTKKCFSFIAAIIEGRKPKECYKRAKLLKLIKLGTSAAREIS
jgi:hypothetical protein